MTRLCTRRVQKCGARVEAARVRGTLEGQERMWLKDVPSPGIAITRSIGDHMAASIGCTNHAEVKHALLREHVDKALVLASDGVWDVLDHPQVRPLGVAIICGYVLERELPCTSAILLPTDPMRLHGRSCARNPLLSLDQQ